LPRPRKRRFCRRYLADRVYKPQGIPMKEITTVELQLDQFEAMRLVDVEQMDQSQAGEAMGVSRGTIQRLLYDGRRQLIEAILQNAAVIINLNKSEVEDVNLHTDQQRRRSGRRHP